MISLAPLNLSRMVLKCYSHVSLQIISSSVYASQSLTSGMTLLIRRRKEAVQSFIPGGMTLYWYIPCGVTKAEISLVRSFNGTCQNTLRRQNFVTYLAFPTLSIKSYIPGIEKVSALDTLFTFLQSVKIGQPSFGLRKSMLTLTTTTQFNEVVLEHILYIVLEVLVLTWIQP